MGFVISDEAREKLKELASIMGLSVSGKASKKLEEFIDSLVPENTGVSDTAHFSPPGGRPDEDDSGSWVRMKVTISWPLRTHSTIYSQIAADKLASLVYLAGGRYANTGLVKVLMIIAVPRANITEIKERIASHIRYNQPAATSRFDIEE